MSKPYSVGTSVEWNWASGTGSGTIEAIFTDQVTRTIKGSEITRNADDANPAYLVRQEDGDRVLKSHSELSPA